MQKAAVLLIFLLIFHDYSFCQTKVLSAKDTIINNIIEQIVLYPQEKLYLHIDKPLYITGEKVWFRAYPVDAVLHKLITKQYVYVELINPLDSVVERVKIRQTNGAFSGYIKLNESLPEGDYTLCAYTENMLNTGEDYFFKKTIRIGNPLSASIYIDVKFKFDTGDKLTAEFSLEHIKTRQKIRPDGLKVMVNDHPVGEINIKNDTVAYVSFKLPERSNKRVLYVEIQKNSQYIVIPYPRDNYDVSFYPEGGYMLEGVRCKVAFKAINSNGLPENVTGMIVDGNGREYAQVKTAHDGMGVFSLTSAAGIKYFAVCKNEQGLEKRFELPPVQKSTCSLKVETIQDNLYVSVLQSSDIQENKKLFLVLHTRGIVHYASNWDNNFNSIYFDTKKFPSGVMQIILFDDKMNPLSERLVFCQNNDQAQVEFNTDQQNYRSRQPVKAGVKINDRKGIPQEGTLSVSITDDTDVKPDTAANILTTLLLTSELKGYINTPAFYFQKNNPEAQQALDMLMMTNGWRRYNIPDIVNGKYEKPEIPIKRGMEVTGKVRGLMLDKPVEKGKVVIFSWDAGYFDETETNRDGVFAFKGIEYQDSTSFIIQALNKRGSEGVEIFPDYGLFPKLSGLPHMSSAKIEKPEEVEQRGNYFAKADKKYSIENGIRMIYLNEVLVRAKAPEKDDKNFSFYMPKSNAPNLNVITKEQLEQYKPSKLSDILRYIPFTRVIDGKVIIERMANRLDNGTDYNFASLIVDDMVINDYDIDNVVDASDIEKIAVLKGSQATILGGNGAGGAVVINTKKGSYSRYHSRKYNIKKVSPLRYQKPAEFYSPRYETPEQRDKAKPDLRTTIYWNPNISISKSGEALFDFYTADASTTYTAVIEGVTSNGTIIQKTKKISRK